MATSSITPDAVKLIGLGFLPVIPTTTCVILRFVARRSTGAIGPDDWCSLVALFFYYTLFATVVTWASIGGVGWPQNELSLGQFELFLKLFWFLQLTYHLAMTTAKLSFIFLYRRLFVTRRFKIVSAVVGIVLAIWLVAALFVAIFQCVPVVSYWQLERPRKCINTIAWYRTNGIINFLFDCAILTMPMPIVWRLQMSLMRKLSVTFVFSLGLFVTAISIVRIHYLFNTPVDNLSGTIERLSIWDSMEPGFSILCGCLPVLPALFTKWRKSLKSSQKNSVDHNSGATDSSEPKTLEQLPVHAHHTRLDSAATLKNPDFEGGFFDKTSNAIINVQRDFSVERV